MRRRHVRLLVTRRVKLQVIPITLQKGQNDCVTVQGDGCAGLEIRDKGHGIQDTGTERWKSGIKATNLHPKPLFRVPYNKNEGASGDVDENKRKR